jgi:hypothetical protein
LISAASRQPDPLRCSATRPSQRRAAEDYLAESAMPVLREGGMIWDMAVKPEPAETTCTPG